MIRIEHNPTRRQLTVFGLSWLVIFGIIGGVACWKTEAFVEAGVFWAIGSIIPTAGLVWPGLMRIVYLAASYATFPIGLGVSYFILAVVYYLVLFPIGLILRLAGYDAMHRCFDHSVKTYWTPREPEKGTERYFKQF
jgi:hypothetical protein